MNQAPPPGQEHPVLTDTPVCADYQGLTPEVILDAVDSLHSALGSYSDGRLLALNSYENRVYQIGMEQGEPLIGKFYRPGRWSDAAILEEHQFSREMADQEIPVVPALEVEGTTLFEHAGYRFSLYQRRGGHAPELDDPQSLEQLGRFFGRMHKVGETAPFSARPELNLHSFGVEPQQYLLDHQWLPVHLEQSYREVTDELLLRVQQAYDKGASIASIRVHGDAHPGNILTRDGVFHIVDLDDARMAPAVQDVWMFLSGDRAYETARLADFLNGYIEFRDFDPAELRLVEALRTLRMIHYAAWLARRWSDPAFPKAFPWFNEDRYWEQHLLALREQLQALERPALIWD